MKMFVYLVYIDIKLANNDKKMESHECIKSLSSHLFPSTISVVVVMVVVVYMCRLGGGDCI